MYAGGSDDFRGYVWKIPPISQLIAARNEISAAEWETGGMGSPVGMSSQNLHHLRRISPLNFSLFFFSAFTEGRKESKIIPYEISTPLCRLTGPSSFLPL